MCVFTAVEAFLLPRCVPETSPLRVLRAILALMYKEIRYGRVAVFT